MIKIIDNKKVDLTNDEYNMYKAICRGYDRPNFKGEELFRDHFESDDDGIINYVKPPTRKFSSMEVFCYLLSIMQNQHLRNIYKQNVEQIKETKENLNVVIKEFKEEFDKLNNIDEKLNKLEKALKIAEELEKKPKPKKKTKKKTAKKKSNK